ncbi:S41 family peptidase [Candidatus Gracilibacteria bacterium]|nr:S41 family peptidase [Candidatus Gracilibacteria bacterium]
MGITLGVVWMYGFNFFSKNIETKKIPPENTIKKESIEKITYDVFSSDKVKKVYGLIQKKYYAFHKKTKKEIESDFIRALVKSLGDKHSTYFDEKISEVFQEDLRGDFEGIGAVVSPDAKGIKITHILDTSPAEKAELKAGDIMTHVDGESIVGLTVSDAIEKIRGPKGTSIEISYLRGEKGDKKVGKTKVTRDIVKIPSVSGKMLDKKIGYIKVSTFGDKTSKDFYKEFNTLTNSGAEAMILDFRYNGGGYLETAIDISSAFLKKNTPVVKIKENDPTKDEILYSYTQGKNNIQIPIIVLINNYSASASEIFAGALQSHKRALILGEQSYGKGSAQELYPLSDNTLVKLTTAKWYTPDDVSIDEKGISPDVFVYLTDEDYEKTYDRQLKSAEKILSHVLDLPEKGNKYKEMIEYAKEINFQE